MFFLRRKRIPKIHSGVLERPGYEPDKRNLTTREIALAYQPPQWVEKKPSDFRHFWNGKYSQDGSGSCLSWQISLMSEVDEWLENGVRRKFSPRSIYGLGYVDGGGMMVENALSLARHNGITLESLLPSNNLNEAQMENLSDYKLDAKEVAKVYKPDHYAYLDRKTFDAVLSFIQNTNKVVGTCIIGDDNFVRGWYYKNGFVLPPGTDRSKYWYHAITLTDGGLINGKKYLSFEHAWGKHGYNHLGYGFINESYLPYMYVMPYFFIDLPDDYIEKTDQRFHYQWTRNLGIGMEGKDVSMLQDALKIEGCYAWGNPTTGYYGHLTYTGVKKFQEKYANEVLKPLNLTEGTGYFGNNTKKKLNSLFK